MSSNGNYVDVASNLYRLEKDGAQYKVAETMNIPVSNMAIANDSLYIYSSEYNYVTSSSTISYAIVDAARASVVSRKIITDGTESQIVSPYGIAVHPTNGDIYITDALYIAIPSPALRNGVRPPEIFRDISLSCHGRNNLPQPPNDNFGVTIFVLTNFSAHHANAQITANEYSLPGYFFIY